MRPTRRKPGLPVPENNNNEPGPRELFAGRAVFTRVSCALVHDKGDAAVQGVERSIDHELVVRVQKGDKTAFDLLVRKYQHRIAKLISRYVYDRSEVEDVSQEAFIKAYRAMAGFRGDSAFYTWLYRIAINTAKNHLVSQGRRLPVSHVFDNEDGEAFEPTLNVPDMATPETSMLTNEIGNTVVAAMDALPEDLRTAITLREIDGLSYEEIAEVMDCPIGTVRSRIFRAREAIDKELKPLLER